MIVTEDWLYKVGEAVWGEVRRFYMPDSCVLASRVLVSVLQHLGIEDVDGIGVACEIFNDAATAHILEHDCMGRDQECVDWFNANGAGISAIGRHPAIEGWTGHVAVLVEKQWLVDLTMSQASAPQFGINLDEQSFVVAGPLIPAWCSGGTVMVIQTDVGFLMHYVAFPKDHGWRPSPDWRTGYGEHDELVRGALDRLAGNQPVYSNELLLVHELIGRI